MKLLAPIENKKDLVNKEYVDSAVDAIEIGGRNYIINSSQDISLTGAGIETTMTNNKIYFQSTEIAESLDGKEVTVSFDCENNITDGSCFLALQTSWKRICNFSSTLNIESKRYNFIFTMPDVTHTSSGALYLQGKFTGSIILRNIKLEIGNKATDWTPAPEDFYTTATIENNGLMSATDKIKLDGIAEGADAVSVTQKLTSGTEIGTVTVNGTGTKLYAPTDISGNAATATALTTSAGSETQPIYFKDGKPVAGDYILKEACTKGIYNVRNLSDLAYSGTTAQTLVPTLSSLAWWNGAYKDTDSNLIYCSKGKFGDIITESKADYITNLSISGKDITYTKGDGSTDTITTQDTVPTLSNISGILPLTKGGTGSTTLLDAKKNLGIPITIEAGVGDVAITNNGWFKIFELPMIAWRSYAITMDVAPCNYINNDFTPISVTVIGEAGNASMEPPVVYLSNGDNSSILDELYIVQNNNSATESFEIWYKNTKTRNQLEFVIYNYHVRGSLDSNLLDKLVIGEPTTPVDAITINKTAYSFSEVAIYQNIGGNAATATALTTSAGSATQPIYFSEGKPVACTYTLEKSVPSNAKFTDTHYTTHLKVGASAIATDNAAATNGNVYLNVMDDTLIRDSHNIIGTGATTVVSDADGNITINSQDTTYSNFVKSGSGAKAGLVPAPSTTAGTTKYLREDGTWQVPPNTDTKVTMTETNPTTSTTYCIPFATANLSNVDSINSTQCINDGIRYATIEGTASAPGGSYLILGNATATGTEGAKYGVVRLYSKSDKYGVMVGPDSATGNRTWRFPDVSGTVITTGNASSVISGGLSTATNQPTSVDITLTKSFYRVRLNTGYLISQSARVNQWSIYTEALSSSTDFTSNPITLYSNAAATTSGGTVTLKVASKVLTISLGTATTATYVVEQFY